jgi:ParB family chromosome partitioning protein
MAAKRGGLGRGLNALINEAEIGGSNSVKEININEIEPNDKQPRKHFDQEKIEQLAASIKEHGIIQPLIVKNEKGYYKIIAGERRWRAARVAGLKTVPVIERDTTPREEMELALIENIQREDLNPIEESEAYEQLMSEYNLTQEKLSEVIGKSRPAIANALRLLSIADEIKKYVIDGELSAGHARALLSCEEKAQQIRFTEKIIEEQLSVRETEELIRNYNLAKKAVVKKFEKDADIETILDKLRQSLKTKVKLVDRKGKGKIEIEYYSVEQREKLIDYLISNKL